MNKKGISPLIATVLIIGFTIVLAVLIMKWALPFVKELQEGKIISDEIPKIQFPSKNQEYCKDIFLIDFKEEIKEFKRYDELNCYYKPSGEPRVDCVCYLTRYGEYNFEDKKNSKKIIGYINDDYDIESYNFDLK